jgi:HTH-type transcriptional regulator / antitoxin HigA
MSTITEYQSLLVDFVPRTIRTDGEYRRTMRQIDRLMKAEKLSRAESQLLELLATLAEQYESSEYPTPEVSQGELLAHLIDARGISQAEVSRETGLPRSVITNVLKGRRGISQANIVRLAKFFHVSPAVFIEGVGVSDSSEATRDRQSPRTPRAVRPRGGGQRRESLPR